MIYYRRNKKILEEFQNKEDQELLIYSNKDDLRNYAITIIYGNELKDVDQIIRTEDLYNHYLATRLLYKKSKYLKQFVNYKQASSKLLYDFTTTLAKKGNSILYNMVSDTSEELGASLFFNEEEYAKEFLKSKLDSLKKIKDMSIYLHKSGELYSLCEFGQNSHVDILQKILK